MSYTAPAFMTDSFIQSIPDVAEVTPKATSTNAITDAQKRGLIDGRLGSAMTWSYSGSGTYPGFEVDAGAALANSVSYLVVPSGHVNFGPSWSLTTFSDDNSGFSSPTSVGTVGTPDSADVMELSFTANSERYWRFQIPGSTPATNESWSINGLYLGNRNELSSEVDPRSASRGRRRLPRSNTRAACSRRNLRRLSGGSRCASVMSIRPEATGPRSTRSCKRGARSRSGIGRRRARTPGRSWSAWSAAGRGSKTSEPHPCERATRSLSR